MRLAILFCFASLPALAAPAVPVANGDFEAGLEGWSFARPKDYASVEATVVSDDVHGGKQCARIVNPDVDGPVLSGIFTGFVPLPDERRTFQLSLWMKAVVAPQMVEIRVASMDRQGKSLSPWNEKGWRFFRPPVTEMVGRWHQVLCDFGAQDEWGGIQVTVWVNGRAADVRIDDLTLAATDPRDRAIERIGGAIAGATGGAVWWEGPLRKVYPEETPPTVTSPGLDLAACGGECETAQLCVRPAGQATVAVTFTPLTGPATLPATVLDARWVGYVPVTKALTGQSILGPTPDPLLPTSQQDLPAGQTSVAWLTLRLPRGTAPGTYRGKALLSGGVAAEVPITVRAYGFDLPERPRLRTISRIWQHHPNQLDLFRRNVAEHRAGGSSYLGGIKVTREGDKLVVDTAGLRDAIAQNLKPYGAEVFNIPNVFLGDASGLYAKDGKWQGYEVFSPEFDRAFGDYCKQVGDAVRAEGVMDYALWQIWDEPHGDMLPKCLHLAKLVKAAVPDARIYLTTGVKAELLDLVGIWNLPWPSTWDAAQVAEARRHGAAIWAYDNSLYALDVADSALLLRAFPWRLRRYDIQGVEWWSVSRWRSDPWQEPNQYEPQNGGGIFLYPGPERQGPPIDSIRWEMYREGVEDYDLLTLLAEAETKAGGDGPARMRAVVEQVAGGLVEVSRDPRLMDTLKRRACERIEALSKGR